MNWLSIIILVGGFLMAFIPLMMEWVIDDYNTFGESIFYGFVSFLLAGVISFVVYAFPFGVSRPYSTDKCMAVKTHTEYLIQAQATDKMEGQFGLFYGRIDDKDVYRFYVKASIGYRMDYLYVQNSRIVESKDTPKVVYYDRIKYLGNEPNWWQRNFFTKKGWEYLCMDDCEHTGVIYVPEGTIIQNKFDNLNL